MLEEDVGRFMTESGVDGPAARELISEPPEIQWAVMQRGPVRSAANPSAALIGRIRDAKNGMHRFGAGAAVAPMLPPAIINAEPGKPLSEVDKFIMDNRLDQSAASSLKGENADVQRMVIQQGPLVNCRNPSGALMSRIRAARTGQQVYRPSMLVPALLPPAAMPALTAGVPVVVGNMGGPLACASVEDSRLNEEAMKAIQMLNAGGP